MSCPFCLILWFCYGREWRGWSRAGHTLYLLLFVPQNGFGSQTDISLFPRSFIIQPGRACTAIIFTIKLGCIVWFFRSESNAILRFLTNATYRISQDLITVAGRSTTLMYTEEGSQYPGLSCHEILDLKTWIIIRSAGAETFLSKDEMGRFVYARKPYACYAKMRPGNTQWGKLKPNDLQFH